jgi:hypothetical protein
MVAVNKSRRVVCTLVRVAEAPPQASPQFIRKPSALVPWADPYIAGLVRRLQSEVRLERAARFNGIDSRQKVTELAMFDSRGAAAWLPSETADLEPPSPTLDGEWEWGDQPRWTVDGEPEE